MNDDILADLALLETPDMPAARALGGGDRMKVQTFLADLALRPGKARGVEVCSLYRYFKGWLLWTDRKATLTHPRRFAALISDAGFMHQFRSRLDGTDRRFLGMHQDSADRVREWLNRHPDTPAERAQFHVRRKP